MRVARLKSSAAPLNGAHQGLSPCVLPPGPLGETPVEFPNRGLSFLKRERSSGLTNALKSTNEVVGQGPDSRRGLIRT